MPNRTRNIAIAFVLMMFAATWYQSAERAADARRLERLNQERERLWDSVKAGYSRNLAQGEGMNIVDREGMKPLPPQVQEDLRLLVSTSPPSENGIADLRRQLNEIATRLERQRQKNEIVEVQKIDPVLEATLKTGMENLVKRIETLEKRQLEKWDVALVFLQLLSGLGVLFAVVFGTTKHFLGK
jgi:hypothetical protein